MFIAKYFEKAKPGAALLTSRDSYELAIFSMTLLGWHSPAGSGYATRAFAFIRISLNIMFSVIYLPIGFLLTYVRSISNMGAEELFTSMELFLNIPPCSLKILTMIWNRWRVYKAQELLDVLDERCVRSSERQLVHRLVNRSSKIFNAYHTLYVLVPVVMIVAGISSNRLPWMIYNPFIDYQSSTEKFLICCVIEFLIAGTAIYGNLIPDIIPVLFGFTVREHLQLLKGRVSRLCTDEEMTEQQNYEELVLCIKDHKMILAYCDHMRPLISLTMFIQFCAIAAALSVTMMHLVFFAHFWSGLGSALYMTGLLMQTFPFSFTCDMITGDQETLATAIFHSNWIDANRPYKMTLIYFMHNVQKPIEFLGGGVFPINLSTNTRVAKFAFSLITCIRQMNIFENLNK